MLFISYSEVVNKYVHFYALKYKWKLFWKKESHHKNKREMQKIEKPPSNGLVLKRWTMPSTDKILGECNLHSHCGKCCDLIYHSCRYAHPMAPHFIFYSCLILDRNMCKCAPKEMDKNLQSSLIYNSLKLEKNNSIKIN